LILGPLNVVTQC